MVKSWRSGSWKRFMRDHHRVSDDGIDPHGRFVATKGQKCNNTRTIGRRGTTSIMMSVKRTSMMMMKFGRCVRANKRGFSANDATSRRHLRRTPHYAMPRWRFQSPRNADHPLAYTPPAICTSAPRRPRRSSRCRAGGVACDRARDSQT